MPLSLPVSTARSASTVTVRTPSRQVVSQLTSLPSPSVTR